MFLGELTYRQKRVFLYLAKQILTVDDGLLDAMEQRYLRNICSEMSRSVNDGDETEVSSLEEVFECPESKRILLVELVALGYCNSDYAEAQGEFAERVARQLAVPIERLRSVEALMSEYRMVQESLARFIED